MLCEKEVTFTLTVTAKISGNKYNVKQNIRDLIRSKFYGKLGDPYCGCDMPDTSMDNWFSYEVTKVDCDDISEFPHLKLTD